MSDPENTSPDDFAESFLKNVPGWAEARSRLTDAEWKAVMEEAAKKAVAKDQPRRLQQSVDAMNALIATGKSLVKADSYEDGYARFLRVVQHAERLWDDACNLLLCESYATALALSITCLEEVGKVSVARFQLALDEARRSQAVSSTPTPSASRRKNPFYSHTQKLVLAAGAGALVNSRLDRVLGMDHVVAFLDRVERDELEALRQSCLYTDATDAALLVPAERIDRAQATFHVVLAGELLAEVGGLEPSEFERLLRRVRDFEVSIGHPSE